jgi:hypothetical protein
MVWWGRQVLQRWCNLVRPSWVRKWLRKRTWRKVQRGRQSFRWNAQTDCQRRQRFGRNQERTGIDCWELPWRERDQNRDQFRTKPIKRGQDNPRMAVKKIQLRLASWRWSGHGRIWWVTRQSNHRALRHGPWPLPCKTQRICGRLTLR